MESRTFKCKGEKNGHMLHYKQVFLNVFEKRESKGCGVLMKHRDKVNPFLDGGWEVGAKRPLLPVFPL